MQTTGHDKSIAALRRRRLKPGSCLGHAGIVLLSGDSRLRCCMGAVRGITKPRLHCWIEVGEYAIDLTQAGGGKVNRRSEYYSRLGVRPKTVKRYRFREIARKVMTGQPLTFWGFVLSRYETAPDNPRDLLK